ncbi:MAG: hypothetical protein ABID09_06185 [Candidatus Omnitrophota bacterium]
MKNRKIVTQVGSLPYEDVKAAVEYSLRHDIPFLPELPRKGDAMLNYIKNPGELSCLEEFKKHSFKTVKIQCVGPATLVIGGYSEDEAIQRPLEHISKIIDGLTAEEIILFLDEPALGHVGFDFSKIWDALFSSFNVISGVHTCGNMDWDKLFSSNIDIISFDASEFDLTKYSGYRSGKRIAWGVQEAENIRDFKTGDLVTLPCGLGSPLHKVDDCEDKLNKLNDIALKIAQGGKDG